jgi:hypothetical protein
LDVCDACTNKIIVKSQDQLGMLEYSVFKHMHIGRHIKLLIGVFLVYTLVKINSLFSFFWNLMNKKGLKTYTYLQLCNTVLPWLFGCNWGSKSWPSVQASATINNNNNNNMQCIELMHKLLLNPRSALTHT